MEPRKPKSPLKDTASGNYFYPVATIDQIMLDDTTRLDDYSIIKNKEISSNLLAAKWVKNNNQYKQSITIEGLNETYNAEVKVTYTDNLEEDLLISKSASCISYATQDDDTITFYCLKKKPKNDIPIEIEVKI
jgi:hypothetical protein